MYMKLLFLDPRYILSEMIYGDWLLVHDVTEHQIYKTIMDAIQTLHGDYGVALLMKSINGKSNRLTIPSWVPFSYCMEATSSPL